MCFHKWSKWEQFIEEGTYYIRKTGNRVPYKQGKQRRKCLRCNKVQEEVIY
jgi:hypothetical protein